MIVISANDLKVIKISAMVIKYFFIVCYIKV